MMKGPRHCGSVGQTIAAEAAGPGGSGDRHPGGEKDPRDPIRREARRMLDGGGGAGRTPNEPSD